MEQLKKEEQEIKKQIAKFSGVDPEVIAEIDEKAQVQSNVKKNLNKFNINMQDHNETFSSQISMKFGNICIVSNIFN